jgi:hypothetical protein
MRRLGVLQLVSRADASLGLELMGLVVRRWWREENFISMQIFLALKSNVCILRLRTRSIARL